MEVTPYNNCYYSQRHITSCTHTTCLDKLPYKMKINTEFNSVTWSRMVKYTELDISEF